MSKPHQQLQPALPIAQLDRKYFRSYPEIVRSLTAQLKYQLELPSKWILAPFSPVVRGEGLGMRGRECRKRNDISDIAHVSPLTPPPPLPRNVATRRNVSRSESGLSTLTFSSATGWAERSMIQVNAFDHDSNRKQRNDLGGA